MWKSILSPQSVIQYLFRVYNVLAPVVSSGVKNVNRMKSVTALLVITIQQGEQT